LYYDNERIVFSDGCRYLNQTADFVTRINTILKEKGITLIFYVVPDKYDVYYNLLNDKYKLYTDNDFIGHLTEELQNEGLYF